MEVPLYDIPGYEWDWENAFTEIEPSVGNEVVNLLTGCHETMGEPDGLLELEKPNVDRSIIKGASHHR